MKKIFAILLALMICVMPLVAFAEEAPVLPEEVEGDNSTTEVEMPTEGEISPPVETPEEGVPDAKTISDMIVNWIMPHIEEISVVITLFLTLIYNIRRNKLLDKSVIKLNNNAVSISENSSSFISNALKNMEGVSGAVTGYQTEITLLLEAYRNTAEDKARLEKTLVEIKNYLAISSKSNLAFADEFAELLTLANIPNYKKEELGEIFGAAKKEIIDAEAKAEIEADNAAKMLLPAATEEVKEDVGEEA